MGPARELETFGMDASDLKALAVDDQTFRLYIANTISTLSERVAVLSDRVGTVAKDLEANKDRLIQIDLKGTHGLGELKERIAAHEKWLEDIRNALSDHVSNCPLVGRMTTIETSLHQIAEDNAARTEMLKGYDEVKKKVDGIAVQVAEGAAAKGQKEKDWRMTITMVGMILTALFSLIGLLQKAKVLP